MIGGHIGESVHGAAMLGGDAVPNRRDVLGDHPASFTPGPLAPVPVKNDIKEVS